MAKIRFLEREHDATLNVDLVTSGASTTEVDVGRGLDRSVTNARILDLPADIDMAALAVELGRMLRSVPDVDRNVRAVAAVTNAKKALDAGKSAEAAGWLEKSGKWAFETAQKVGADLAESTIKSLLGLK